MKNRPTLIKRSQTRLSPESVVTGEGVQAGISRAPAPRKGDQPLVNVRRSGDVIEALEVTCPCGRSTVIECLYDAKKTEVTP